MRDVTYRYYGHIRYGTSDDSIWRRRDGNAAESLCGCVGADRHRADPNPSPPKSDYTLSLGIFHDSAWTSGDGGVSALSCLAHPDFDRVGSMGDSPRWVIEKQVPGRNQRSGPRSGALGNFDPGDRFSSMDGTNGVH